MSRPVLYVAGGYASGFVAHAIKAHADKIGARVVGKLDFGPPKSRAAPREAVKAAREAAAPIQPQLI